MSNIAKRICPICGKSVSDREVVIEGLCLDCFIKNRLNKPGKITIKMCPVCGRIYMYGVWLEFSEDLVKTRVLDKIEKWCEKEVGKYGLHCIVNYEGGGEAEVLFIKEDKSASRKISIEVEFEKQVCNDCIKRAGGYYEAIIQFRSEDESLGKKLKKLIDKVLSELPYAVQDSILEVKEVKEGVDVKVMNQTAARSIVSAFTSKYPSTIKESHKLVSARGGIKKTRVSFSVRVHKDYSGEIYDFKGKPALVTKSGDYIEILVVPERRRLKIEYEKAKNLLNPYRDRVYKVVVTTISPKEVYYMKMEGSYELNSIPANRVVGIPEEGCEALLVVYEGEEYLIIP